jgi:4-methyl-5(b-hydroxyethyl)-thiazole monophosphate biosynthesis
MAKVYVFLAEGFEDVEALIPIDVLRRGGVDVTTVSISEFPLVTSAHGVNIEADILFEQGEFDNADLLMLPGGMPGASNLFNHSGLCEALKAQYQAGKKISAICAAPGVVLAPLGILEGKQATCYPGCQEPLGESYVGGLVVESKNVITAKGPGLSSDFAFCIIERLAGSEVADAVYDAAQY